VTELVDGTARAMDNGAVTAERRLDEPVTKKLAALAQRCAAAKPPDAVTQGVPPPDGMDTTVEIEVEGRRSSISYGSGDDVSPELVELVAAVLETPYRDPGTRWLKKKG
jgi:hypothetical protein